MFFRMPVISLTLRKRFGQEGSEELPSWNLPDTSIFGSRIVHSLSELRGLQGWGLSGWMYGAGAVYQWLI